MSVMTSQPRGSDMNQILISGSVDGNVCKRFVSSIMWILTPQEGAPFGFWFLLLLVTDQNHKFFLEIHTWSSLSEGPKPPKKEQNLQHSVRCRHVIIIRSTSIHISSSMRLASDSWRSTSPGPHLYPQLLNPGREDPPAPVLF